MLNLKVARECDQPLQEVHDLPQSTFGLENYVERVETLVTSEGKNAAPHYVGVYGMGGVGKTLLLQRLYGSPRVHGHFQGAKFIWRTVGQTPDIMALYQSLREELGLKPELYVNAEDYKLKLYNQFRQRRVFLVLDDVWEDKAFDSLDLAKGKGSVTLLSTRNQSLLQRASPQISQEHISPLSKEDSWSLFCVHAFGAASNVTRKLEALARSMAEECKGLPLALKVIGRAMYGKTSPELQWEPFLKKLRESCMQERSIEEELYECLKLGYDLLSEDDSCLKDCFLYFAAFPEDESFSFQDILWGWRGEGLVPANDAVDPRVDVFSLLSKLSSRSFIESDIKLEINDLLQQFKLHDVMRDLAFYILEKDCDIPPAKELYIYRAGRNLEEVPKECTTIPEALKLSLYRNKLERLPENFYAPKLLSLLLGDNPIISLPASFLRSFQKLKVLDLSGGMFSYLPEEIGDLKHLISLDLSYCEYLKILPDAVRKLHMLKQLKLHECGLNYLPSGIVDLTSLQVLRTLGSELIWSEHAASGVPSAQSLCDVCPTVEASLEDICELRELTELYVFGKIDRAVKLPHNISTLTKLGILTELSISGITDQGVNLPHNISALTNLKILELSLDNVESLPTAMAYSLKQLQELNLMLKKLKYLPKSFTHYNAFPALIIFRLYYSFDLVEFPEVVEGALPKLRTIEIDLCTSLETLPFSLELLRSLETLDLVSCEQTVKDCCRQYCEKSEIWRSFYVPQSGSRTIIIIYPYCSRSISFVKSAILMKFWEVIKILIGKIME
jgi:hypothetical protein